MVNEHPRIGYLILDRKGEYIKDTTDQRGNTVYGLHNHPKAPERMVVVSMRDEFAKMHRDGVIRDYLKPSFNIQDVEPIDLADFLTGLTDVQADLIRDYAFIPDLYQKLLSETAFGAIDNRNWFRAFPGLFNLKDKGKQLLKGFESTAAAEGRDTLKDEELAQLQGEMEASKAAVLERGAQRIKRFCLNPFFGGSAKGSDILSAPSCLPQILDHLASGNFVYIDMRGRSDEDYTMVAALFARRLLTHNKDRDDKDHICACIVMEEAHNILSEDQMTKGTGSGSVFVEFAREGRSFKLGFILVTQQPDARSIAPQVVKTIDSVVAFNMPPEDARHLHRLKSAFTSMDLEISNAAEFEGVAVAGGGPILFRSCPIEPSYMRRCADGSLEERLVRRVGPDMTPEAEVPRGEPVNTLEDRVTALMQQRRETIVPVALATMNVWQGKPVDGVVAPVTPRHDAALEPDGS